MSRVSEREGVVFAYQKLKVQYGCEAWTDGSHPLLGWGVLSAGRWPGGWEGESLAAEQTHVCQFQKKEVFELSIKRCFDSQLQNHMQRIRSHREKDLCV